MLKQIRCTCGYSGSAVHIGVTYTGSRGKEEELSACPKCNLVYADIKHHSLEEEIHRESRNR